MTTACRRSPGGSEPAWRRRRESQPSRWRRAAKPDQQIAGGRRRSRAQTGRHPTSRRVGRPPRSATRRHAASKSRSIVTRGRGCPGVSRGLRRAAVTGPLRALRSASAACRSSRNLPSLRRYFARSPSTVCEIWRRSVAQRLDPASASADRGGSTIFCAPSTFAWKSQRSERL